MKRGIIYIGKKQYLINKAIENKLAEADFNVLSLSEDIDDIHRHRHDADIFLYHPESDQPGADSLLHYLSDLCRDEHKSLCLINDHEMASRISRSGSPVRVAFAYDSPVDVNMIVADMLELAAAHEEFRRRKTILIVDDDPDFLAIMERWLKNSYTAVGACSGGEALEYLSLHRPDLILLDYSMPELDGYEVMGKIHQNPQTASIPIIFLTGINDRESVMRIIKHRPDGYLLKSMKKADLLDTLERFFAERILNPKMQRRS